MTQGSRCLEKGGVCFGQFVANVSPNGDRARVAVVIEVSVVEIALEATQRREARVETPFRIAKFRPTIEVLRSWTQRDRRVHCR
jgi:hypothetical protein